ncbi:hypothetical protein OF385_08885 [Glutamicibacter sp. JL.03c]|uniref:trypsin-like serine peptidase n=1 Tax=Glutamicibacter sp. JL.03c TaxID=2984842 RepID=UPI0021F74F3A|nr:hypothetical protein [Glutamicibacter sp. JL.03c]UYQ76179.1 hypothetical protein OF385_08885 [Glutamicibacter sp. JL.03c]
MQVRTLKADSSKLKGRRKLAGAALLAGALMLSAAPMASAAPSSTSDDIKSIKISAQKADSALDYWTADRMKAAKNADTLVAGKSGSAAKVDTSKAAKVPGHAANSNAGKISTKAGGKTRGQEAPVSHIGKVFFTLGGQDYVCSGNAVVSANESTVSTAGHCLNEGPGAFATRWVFVPAYENGSAPYGSFAATELVTTSQWSNDGDITYDTGFAVVSNSSGSTLTDTVGASGVAFNQPRGEYYTAYGYPAASPFNGETLQSCAGSASDDPFGQTQSQGISCNMTGGSSGGPWFLGTGSSTYQNSVNSFGYNTVRNTMFGPYWGSVIQQAYQNAQS